MKLSKTRSSLYTIARLIGDVQAVKGGPNKMLRRLLRKKAGRMTGRGLSTGFSKFFK